MNTPHRIALCSLISLTALLAHTGAHGAESAESLVHEIAVLRATLAKQQEELSQQQRLLEAQSQALDRLREQVLANDTAPALEQLQRETEKSKLAAQESARVSMTGARPTITSADGRASLSLRGVVQLDTADYQQRRDGGAALDTRRGSVGATNNRESSAARDLSSGSYFRRARLGVEGNLARDFNYRLMLELGGSGTEGPTRINDAWIGYTGFAPFTLQLGAFSPASNMDDSTQVESSLFIERASAAELSRTLAGADGRIGLGVRGSGARWMSALTLTTRTVSDPEVFDSQLAAVGRFGMLAATAADYNIHAGLSGSWVFQPADQGASAAGGRYPIRLRDRPELRVDSTRLIDTGPIDADSAYVAGAELGMQWKSWYFQAENFWYGIERAGPTALRDPSFGGYYAQGSWILSGETRRYDVASGAFQAPRPFIAVSSTGGRGAWELALRYSHMDLDAHAGMAGALGFVDSVRGGTQDIWAFGINWYLTANLRLLFNYLHVDVDRLNPAAPGNLMPFGPSPATPPDGAQVGQQLDIFAIRSQYSF